MPCHRTIHRSIACLILLLATCHSMETLTLHVNLRKPIAITSEEFLSLTIDPVALLSLENANEKYERSRNMAKALSPAYVRIGGPRSNSFETERASHHENTSDVSDSIFSEANWKLLRRWTESVELDAIVCIAAEFMADGTPPRYSNGSRTNETVDLVTWSDQMGFDTNWQLGYECQTRCNESGSELGRYAVRLRDKLDASTRYRKSLLVGPDVVDYATTEQREYLQEFFRVADNTLAAVTWHPKFVEINSSTPYQDDILLRSWKNFAVEKENLSKAIGRTASKKPLWIAESSPEQHKEQFLGAIVLANRLGTIAKLGARVYMKQPSNLSEPKPDYWLSLLYKRLVSREVFQTKVDASNETRNLHFYCQCAVPSKYHGNGSIVIFGVNLTPRGIIANLKGATIKTLHQYVLLPGQDGLLAEDVLLNDEQLNLTDGKDLPDIKPTISSDEKGLSIQLPSGGIGFWVIPDIKVKSCMDNNEKAKERILSRRVEEKTVNIEISYNLDEDVSLRSTYSGSTNDDVSLSLQEKKEKRRNTQRARKEIIREILRKFGKGKEFDALKKYWKKMLVNRKDKRPSTGTKKPPGPHELIIQNELTQRTNRLVEESEINLRRPKASNFEKDEVTSKIPTSPNLESFASETPIENLRSTDVSNVVEDTQNQTSSSAREKNYPSATSSNLTPEPLISSARITRTIERSKRGVESRSFKFSDRRLVGRNQKRRDTASKNAPMSVTPSKVSFADSSNENNFYGFLKQEPTKDFPGGDVFLTIAEDSKEKGAQDYDYVKDDDEVGENENQKEPMRMMAMTTTKRPTTYQTELDRDAWIKGDSDHRARVPSEFFEKQNAPRMHISRTNLRNGTVKLWETESIGEIEEESELDEGGLEQIFAIDETRTGGQEPFPVTIDTLRWQTGETVTMNRREEEEEEENGDHDRDEGSAVGPMGQAEFVKPYDRIFATSRGSNAEIGDPRSTTVLRSKLGDLDELKNLQFSRSPSLPLKTATYEEFEQLRRSKKGKDDDDRKREVGSTLKRFGNPNKVVSMLSLRKAMRNDNEETITSKNSIQQDFTEQSTDRDDSIEHLPADSIEYSAEDSIEKDSIGYLIEMDGVKRSSRSMASMTEERTMPLEHDGYRGVREESIDNETSDGTPSTIGERYLRTEISVAKILGKGEEGMDGTKNLSVLDLSNGLSEDDEGLLASDKTFFPGNIDGRPQEETTETDGNESLSRDVRSHRQGSSSTWRTEGASKNSFVVSSTKGGTRTRPKATISKKVEKSDTDTSTNTRRESREASRKIEIVNASLDSDIDPVENGRTPGEDVSDSSRRVSNEFSTNIRRSNPSSTLSTLKTLVMRVINSLINEKEEDEDESAPILEEKESDKILETSDVLMPRNYRRGRGTRDDQTKGSRDEFVANNENDDVQGNLDSTKIAYIVPLEPIDYVGKLVEQDDAIRNEETDKTNRDSEEENDEAAVLMIAKPFRRVDKILVRPKDSHRNFQDSWIVGKEAPRTRYDPAYDGKVQGCPDRRYKPGRNHYTLVDYSVKKPGTYQNRRRPQAERESVDSEFGSPSRYTHVDYRRPDPNVEDRRPRQRHRRPNSRSWSRRKVFAIDPSSYKRVESILQLRKNDEGSTTNDRVSAGRNLYRLIWVPETTSAERRFLPNELTRGSKNRRDKDNLAIIDPLDDKKQRNHRDKDSVATRPKKTLRIRLGEGRSGKNPSIVDDEEERAGTTPDILENTDTELTEAPVEATERFDGTDDSETKSYAPGDVANVTDERIERQPGDGANIGKDVGLIDPDLREESIVMNVRVRRRTGARTEGEAGAFEEPSFFVTRGTSHARRRDEGENSSKQKIRSNWKKYSSMFEEESIPVFEIVDNEHDLKHDFDLSLLARDSRDFEASREGGSMDEGEDVDDSTSLGLMKRNAGPGSFRNSIIERSNIMESQKEDITKDDESGEIAMSLKEVSCKDKAPDCISSGERSSDFEMVLIGSLGDLRDVSSRKKAESLMLLPIRKSDRRQADRSPHDLRKYWDVGKVKSLRLRGKLRDENNMVENAKVDTYGARTIDTERGQKAHRKELPKSPVSEDRSNRWKNNLAASDEARLIERSKQLDDGSYGKKFAGEEKLSTRVDQNEEDNDTNRSNDDEFSSMLRGTVSKLHDVVANGFAKVQNLTGSLSGFVENSEENFDERSRRANWNNTMSDGNSTSVVQDVFGSAVTGAKKLFSFLDGITRVLYG